MKLGATGRPNSVLKLATYFLNGGCASQISAKRESLVDTSAMPSLSIASVKVMFGSVNIVIQSGMAH
jgi:hypothetical protein